MRVQRIRRVVLTLVLTAGLLVSTTGVGSANHWQWKKDGNDVDGIMDLKRVAIKIPGHTTKGDKGVVSCRGDFHEDLTAEQVVVFYCYYDIKGDEADEYQLIGNWDGSELVAHGRKISKDGTFPVKIFMKDGDVVMEIEKKKLHGRKTFLRWRAISYKSPEYDYAPNTGSYKYKFKD